MDTFIIFWRNVIDVGSMNFICGLCVGCVVTTFLLLFSLWLDHKANVKRFKDEIFEEMELIFKDYSPHLRSGEIELPAPNWITWPEDKDIIYDKV